MAAVYQRPIPTGRVPPGRNAQIYFSTRHTTHYDFTNVSDHPIKYKELLYPTAEHLFQAFKFFDHQPQIAELVRRSSDPRLLAHTYSDQVRQDWASQHLYYMERVLTLKFSTYPGLLRDLLATGDAQLILLGSDQYWAQHEDGRGLNEFGNVLMRVRNNFRGSRAIH